MGCLSVAQRPAIARSNFIPTFASAGARLTTSAPRQSCPFSSVACTDDPLQFTRRSRPNRMTSRKMNSRTMNRRNRLYRLQRRRNRTQEPTTHPSIPHSTPNSPSLRSCSNPLPLPNPSSANSSPSPPPKPLPRRPRSLRAGDRRIATSPNEAQTSSFDLSPIFSRRRPSRFSNGGICTASICRRTSS